MSHPEECCAFQPDYDLQVYYKYNTSNRLIVVDEPSGTQVRLTYDGNGNCVSKSVASGSTTWS